MEWSDWSLALVLSGISLVVAAFTPRRGLGVAAIVTGLLMVSGIVQMLVAIAEQKGYATLASYLPALNPFSLVDGIAVRLLGVAPTDNATYPAGAPGLLVFTAVAIVTIGASLIVLVRRYRKGGGV